MPTLIDFGNVRIYINTKEANHATPHFHAEDSDGGVTIRINNLSVFGNNMKQRSLDKVLEWDRIHGNR